MATTSTIINMALQKLGVSGGPKPARPEDLATGLTTLQSLYRQLISSGSLGRARPVVPTGNYIARENDRVFRNSTNVGSISLPDVVVDDFDSCEDSHFYDRPVCSPPRPPRDGSFVIINDAQSGNTAEYIYEGYINQWVSLHDLSLQEYQEVTDPQGNVIEIIPASNAPLSYRDQNGLAALLATKLVDYYGSQLNPATVRDALNYEIALATRFGEPEEELRNPLFD